jgi:hypothetical protein
MNNNMAVIVTCVAGTTLAPHNIRSRNYVHYEIFQKCATLLNAKLQNYCFLKSRSSFCFMIISNEILGLGL